jgi:hypothetical protein
MRRIILASALLLATPCALRGQDTAAVVDSVWRLSVDAGLAATQAAYSDNWVGGEVGSFNWTFTSKSEAYKQLTGVLHTSNTLKLAFGQTYTQLRLDDGSTHWQAPQKSTDLIDFESLLRFTFQAFVDPYAALRVETQFMDASYRPIKRYFSPVRVTESGGLIRVFVNRPKEFEFKSRVGFALRQLATKVIVDTALETTEWNTTNEGGVESVTDLFAALDSRLSYTSKLTLFKAFFYSESDALLAAAPGAGLDDWKDPDVNWEHIVSASIAKYLQTNLYFQLLYDKQVDAGIRIKETLGLGLTYKLL